MLCEHDEVAVIISMKGHEAKLIKSTQFITKLGFKKSNIIHLEGINGRLLKPIFCSTMVPNNMTIPVTLNALKDLKYGRVRHAGISSLGALGCAMSHYTIWKKFIDGEYDVNSVRRRRIFIFEDDFEPSTESRNIVDFIHANICTSNKAVCLLGYVSFFGKKEARGALIPVFKNKEGTFWGAHAYEINRGAAEILCSNFFPIDIQVDAYIAECSNQGLIELYLPKAKSLFTQNNITGSILNHSHIPHGCDTEITKLRYGLKTNALYIILSLIILIQFILIIRRQKCFSIHRPMASPSSF